MGAGWFLVCSLLLALVASEYSFDPKAYEACLTSSPLRDEYGHYQPIYPNDTDGRPCEASMFLPKSRIAELEFGKRGRTIRAQTPATPVEGGQAWSVALTIARNKQSARRSECLWRSLIHSAIPQHYCTFRFGRRVVLVTEWIQTAISVRGVEPGACGLDPSIQAGESSDREIDRFCYHPDDIELLRGSWKLVLQEIASLFHLLHLHGYSVGEFSDKKVVVIDTQLWKRTNAGMLPNPVYLINLSQIRPLGRAPEARSLDPWHFYAPEQAQAALVFSVGPPPEVMDPRAIDWYRLGLVLYMLLTGWMPFMMAANKVQALTMIREGVLCVENAASMPKEAISPILDSEDRKLVFGLLAPNPKYRSGMVQICRWAAAARPQIKIPGCETLFVNGHGDSQLSHRSW